MASLARRYGFADWKTIYNHAANADLRKKRPNPNLLMPGDRVTIPEKTKKEVTCAVEQKHVFKVKLATTMLRVRLRDPEGVAIQGKPYTLEVGGKSLKGTTKDDGLVEQRIPADAREAVVQLEVDGSDKPHPIHLRIGHLDPAEEVSGIQARLANLGYRCNVSGVLDDSTLSALHAFQSLHGLTLTAEPDDATRAKLLELHAEG